MSVRTSYVSGLGLSGLCLWIELIGPELLTAKYGDLPAVPPPRIHLPQARSHVLAEIDSVVEPGHCNDGVNYRHHEKQDIAWVCRAAKTMESGSRSNMRSTWMVCQLTTPRLRAHKASIPVAASLSSVASVVKNAEVRIDALTLDLSALPEELLAQARAVAAQLLASSHSRGHR